jgi:hypothetical protein
VKWLVAIALLAWFVFGSPPRGVANWVWPDSPATWEEAEAFYYPDRSDFSTSVSSRPVADLDECRDWVQEQATLQPDPQLLKGYYECAFGRSGKLGSITVYDIASDSITAHQSLYGRSQ